MDYKNLAEQYKLQIEAWYLFYQDFVEYDTHISNARGIVVDMFSELIKAKKTNPKNNKIEKTEQRLKLLLSIIDKFEAMASRCQNQQVVLRKKSAYEFEYIKTIEGLKKELEAIKKAIDGEH